MFQTSACRNGGILRNNTCDCAPGYVGQTCELGPMRGTHILLKVCSSSLSKLDCYTSLLSSSFVHLYQLKQIQNSTARKRNKKPQTLWHCSGRRNQSSHLLQTHTQTKHKPGSFYSFPLFSGLAAPLRLNLVQVICILISLKGHFLPIF